jgi:Family of unknown function (DUF6174)
MTRLPTPRWRWIATGLALGVLAALFYSLHEPGASLTREGLAAARVRWESQAPASYKLEVTTGGATGSRQSIVVRNGRVVSMTAAGAEAARSAWQYWSVDGLFGFLDTELTNAEHPHQAYGVGSGEVVLRVRFDQRLGYPEYFLRHVMGKKLSIEWHVTGFEPFVAPDSPEDEGLVGTQADASNP